jgi:signal transduction histidine kinase
VVQVGSLRPRQFGDDEIQLLQVVADRVALTIEHARLLEAARVARVEAEVAAAQLRTQDEFLAVAAHELKTPITSVKSAAQLLLRRYARQGTPDPQQVQRGLQTIDRQIDRLTRLVTLLLESVRLQAGRLQLERQATNLTRLVQQAAAQAQSQTEQHQLVVAAGPEVWAEVDALRLEQVVRNLLENAIKFSPDGGRIDISVQRVAGNQVELAVRDRGLGIAPEHRAHLFERFYQAHGSSHQSGLGLGLYISRGIVAQHGGTIRAEFPADGGTRMVVTLPGARAAGAEGGALEPR